ncbi:anti-sigma factor [Planctomicrobium piriforme]|uniref:Zinc-finger n=1 Tax=Planctomicrobium piriforme TaxID=1576369 RepID=A0A1I3SR44_9PLAN|nr:hypothetical protein [Planctomicrobium piriforme]SFJ61284.1 hypothetical protein SAMN05421753_12552 [Planctomicrobium piriforme]
MNTNGPQFEQPSGELPPGEVLLLASRYLSGELDSIAAADFEQRLADDQFARDALADVVQLTAAMQSLPATELQVFPVQPRPAAFTTSRRRLVLATLLSTAAVLALIAVVNIARLPSELPESPLEMADIWTAVPEIEIPLDPEEEPFEPLAALDVPDWMFAALAADDAVPNVVPVPSEIDEENL